MGQREVAGAASNPVIVKLWAYIRAPFTDDNTPWCSAFVGGCLEQAGIRSSRSAAALSYLKWGVELEYAIPGAVAVMERKNTKGKVIGGHVAFVDGVDEKGHIVCLGGNQGDAVTHAAFPASRIISYRWPIGIPVPSMRPLPMFLDTVSASDRLV